MKDILSFPPIDIVLNFQVGESIRRNAPKEIQCSMFCGGRRCKYEQGSSWKKEDMAIDGIYSHWITENILAMARPNTAAMKKYNLITQFKVRPQLL